LLAAFLKDKKQSIRFRRGNRQLAGRPQIGEAARKALRIELDKDQTMSIRYRSLAVGNGRG
jgi:hypothetical protein